MYIFEPHWTIVVRRLTTTDALLLIIYYWSVCYILLLLLLATACSIVNQSMQTPTVTQTLYANHLITSCSGCSSPKNHTRQDAFNHLSAHQVNDFQLGVIGCLKATLSPSCCRHFTPSFGLGLLCTTCQVYPLLLYWFLRSQFTYAHLIDLLCYTFPARLKCFLSYRSRCKCPCVLLTNRIVIGIAATMCCCSSRNVCSYQSV